MLLTMFSNILQTVICVFSVYILAFIDFGNGQEAMEMIEQGKTQYQLLEERGRLPRYGKCWQAAVEHLHDGCRYLSEETQSDIALHITNCFLAMSGHEVYNCELDKKPNLRGICINSMSDRAFNVYTEFYTHTQNMCWFLRGQLWQEKITRNTVEVSKQLESSLRGQEQLLDQQQESLKLQDKLIQHGHSLEHILNLSRVQATRALDEIQASALQHRRLLMLVADSLTGLQSWLMGEISWFDSLLFYLSSTLVTLALTSTARTAAARPILLLILSLNVLAERTICASLEDTDSVHQMQNALHQYIWWCRRITIFACALILLILMYTYRDYEVVNHALLLDIQQQNRLIHNTLNAYVMSDTSKSMQRQCHDVNSPSELEQTTPVRTIKYNLRSRSFTPFNHVNKAINNNTHV